MKKKLFSLLTVVPARQHPSLEPPVRHRRQPVRALVDRGAPGRGRRRIRRRGGRRRRTVEPDDELPSEQRDLVRFGGVERGEGGADRVPARGPVEGGRGGVAAGGRGGGERKRSGSKEGSSCGGDEAWRDGDDDSDEPKQRRDLSPPRLSLLPRPLEPRGPGTLRHSTESASAASSGWTFESGVWKTKGEKKGSI